MTDSTHTGDPERTCKDGDTIHMWNFGATKCLACGYEPETTPFQPAPATEACGHEFPVIPGQHSTDAICKKCGSSRREARKVEREAAPAASETGCDRCAGNEYRVRELSVQVAEQLATIERLEAALRGIREHKPSEVVKDEFAYNRMVKAFQDAAAAALEG